MFILRKNDIFLLREVFKVISFHEILIITLILVHSKILISTFLKEPKKRY